MNIDKRLEKVKRSRYVDVEVERITLETKHHIAQFEGDCLIDGSPIGSIRFKGSTGAKDSIFRCTCRQDDAVLFLAFLEGEIERQEAAIGDSIRDDEKSESIIGEPLPNQDLHRYGRERDADGKE